MGSRRGAVPLGPAIFAARADARTESSIEFLGLVDYARVQSIGEVWKDFRVAESWITDRSGGLRAHSVQDPRDLSSLYRALLDQSTCQGVEKVKIP